jgi:copper chaperone CopZ
METAGKQNLQKCSFRIGGMFCAHCRNTIEKGLKNTAGILEAKVSYHT